MTASLDGRLLFWDCREKRPVVAVFKNTFSDGFTAMHWDPNNNVTYAGILTGHVLQYDTRNGKTPINTKHVYLEPIQRFRPIDTNRNTFGVVADSRYIRFMHMPHNLIVHEKLCDDIVRDVFVNHNSQSIASIQENSTMCSHYF